MDNSVDNCGLLFGNECITIPTPSSFTNDLWITVDSMWINKCIMTWTFEKLSLFHRPTTVINLFNSYRYIGGKQ